MAVSATVPRPSRNALLGGVASRWLSSKRRSPPSSDWPSLATPAVIERATELTPPIAATPSAMQVRKIMKPDRPPRISRSEKRKASASIRDEGMRRAHAVAASAGVASIRPERMATWREQRAASAGSWVTSTSVMPRSPGLGEQQVGDLPAGRLVEIAGRLVGDEDARLGRQRPGDRHALLLAARQLAGIVGDAVAQADGSELARRHARTDRHGRQVPAARRHFPAPSCWGSGGRTGRRCRCCGRGTPRSGPRSCRSAARRRCGPCPNRPVPARRGPSAASTCRSPTGRRCRSPRRWRHRG